MIKNTIKLIKQAGTFLLANKKILFYPCIALIICVILTLVLFYPLRNNPAFFNTNGSSAPVSAYDSISAAVISTAWYLLCAFVITFFNTATITYTYSRIQGQKGSLWSGFRLACSRIKTIFLWSIINSTVGLLISAMEKSSNILVSIIGYFIDVVWHLVSYLVVPIFIVEKIGPIKAFQKSSELLRKTGQDQCIADFSVGLVFLLINIPLFYALSQIPVVDSSLQLSLGLVIIVCLIISVILNMTINSIFQINYYLYLKNAPMPKAAITPDLMSQLVKLAD